MVKTTVINVPVKVHREIKVYCSRNGYPMGQWVAETILNIIKKENAKRKRTVL